MLVLLQEVLVLFGKLDGCSPFPSESQMLQQDPLPELQGRRSTSTIRWSTTIIIEMTRMKTYSKISMMTTKQIINNYNDINQHNHDEADDGDTNKDVARMSKMTTTTTMAKISQ
jgi:hypothetical protein